MTSWLSQCAEISLNCFDFASSPLNKDSFLLNENKESSLQIKCHDFVNTILKKISENSETTKMSTKTLLSRYLTRCLNKSEKEFYFGASSEGSSHIESNKIRLEILLFGKQTPEKSLTRNLDKKLGFCVTPKIRDSDYSGSKQIDKPIPSLIEKLLEKQQLTERITTTPKAIEKNSYTNNQSKVSKELERYEKFQQLNAHPKYFTISDNDKQQQRQSEDEKEDEEETKIIADKLKDTLSLSSHTITSTKLLDIAKSELNEKTKNFSPLTPDLIIPTLPLPNTGLFALYYILTKQGILSDFSAYSTYKNEMEFNQTEIDATYKQRIEQLREAVDRETTVKRWGVLGKFFSWMASFLGSVSGLILIFSGVGAIMGAGLLAAGLFSLVNSLVEWTGGWNYIAKLLPGNNINKKRAVISWMKIGISIICLVLSLVTCFATGGISQAMRAAQGIPQTIITILMSGFGVAIIGESISSFRLFNSISHVKTTERILEALYHKRSDLNERAESDVESIENLFDSLASALNLDREIAQIDTIFYR